MKKSAKKILSCFLVVMMLIVAVPFAGLQTASAICCRKDYFDKSRYTLTGNMAYDVAMIAKSQKGRTCSDFGYSGFDYGAWCDEFVADCIENAGGDNSIVAHGGNVSDFESVMRARGAVETSSPQTGDLVFFGNWHVEIVTKVENGVVYCAGGNNGSSPGSCNGERNASYIGSDRLYLRPNYNGGSTPQPTTSWDFSKPATYPSYSSYLKVGSRDDGARRVSFLQTALNWLHYDCGSVDGQFGSNTEAQVRNYQSANGLECDGIVGPDTWNSIVSHIALDIGSDFWAYIILRQDWRHIENSVDGNIQLATNGNDNNDPRQIWHFVRTADGNYKITNAFDDKGMDVFNVDPSDGTNVYMYPAHDGSNQRWIVSYNSDGGSYIIRTGCGMSVLDSNGASTAPGTNIQIWSYNDSSAQEFAIYKIDYSRPAAPDATTLSVSMGDTVKFNWTKVPLKSDKFDSRNYRLRIWKGTSIGELGTEIIKKDTTDTSMTLKLDEGTYTANITTINSKYLYSSSRSNPVTFTVKNHVHTWELSEEKPATCMEAGLKTYTCPSCNETKTETVDILEHNYSGKAVSLKNGTHQYLCLNGCGNYGVGKIDDATENCTYGEWLVLPGSQLVGSLCESGHTEYRLCSTCGNREIKIISEIHHKKGKATIENRIEADCQHEGSYDEVYYCVNAKGAPTIYGNCCGKELERKTVIIPKTDHSWGSGVITSDPTCTENGAKIYTCSVCGDTYSEPIPAIGHIDDNHDGMCDLCDKDLGGGVADCDHICHKGGFAGFIYKIIRVFWKLFKINKTCACGVNHY